MDSFSEVFEDVKKHCLADPNVSQIGFDKWIKPLEADKLENKTAYIFAQSEFAKQTVMDFYYDLIKKSFSEVLGIDVEVSISNKNEIMDDSQQFNYVIENEKHLERSLNDGLYDLTFDNFIKGKSNELAYAFCTAVAEINIIIILALITQQGGKSISVTGSVILFFLYSAVPARTRINAFHYTR